MKCVTICWAQAWRRDNGPRQHALCGVSGQWRLSRSPILPYRILNTDNSVWLPVSRPSAMLKNEPSKRCGQLAGHRRVPCENDSSFNVQPPDGIRQRWPIACPEVAPSSPRNVSLERWTASESHPTGCWQRPRCRDSTGRPCTSLSAICDSQPGITQLIPLFICHGRRVIQCVLCKWAVMLYSEDGGEYISHRAWAEHTVQVILTEDTLRQRAVSDAWQQWQQLWAMLLFLIILIMIMMMMTTKHQGYKVRSESITVVTIMYNVIIIIIIL